MYRKNVASQFIHFQGVDASTGGIKSGVTWTVRRCIDGTFAAATGTATEDGTTGWYKFALSQADTNGNNIAFNFTGTGAVPQTVNIVTTACDPTAPTNFGITGIPAVASGSAGALLIDGTGTAAISNSAGKVLLQATQAGVTIPTVTTVTNQLTAAAIATGVWQDTTAGDFTTASSIGKSLFTSGAVPGAAGGLFIAGANAAVTINGTAAAGATPAVAALTLTGGAASITAGGVASQAILATGGAGAASTNGAAEAVKMVGGGTNTVASAAHGLTVTGTSTGSGLNATSGGGATGNGITATAASTNGNGASLTGTGTGNGMLATGGAGAGGDGIEAAAGGGVDLRANQTGNLTGAVSGAVGSVTGAVGSVTGNVGGNVVGSVASVTAGVSLAASQHVIVDSGTVTTVTNQLTAAQIATGVWTDTTAGDFTTALSVGKSVMNGVALGTGLTVASVSGAVGSVTGNVGGNVVGSVASVTARVTANADQLAGQTVTAAAGVTFPTSVASPTNITAGTITTVTNLTNAPTAGDFTATMKTSITTAATAATPTAAAVTGAVGSVTGAVGSVTGNVGGNVVGSVASVTAAVSLSAGDSPVMQSGTAAAGGASTITLQTALGADNLPVGAIVKITSGTGAKQARIITGYVNATKVATVDRAWVTNPDATSVYTIIYEQAPKLDSSLKVAGVVLTDTITTYTGNTPQTGDSFARIGATGSGLTSLAPASTALATTQWTNALATSLGTLAGHDPGATLGTSTLTQTQVTGGAYALNSASFVWNAALDLSTTQKTSVTTAATAATPTAAAVTANVNADVKKVNGVTVTGVGTSGSPWGP